MEIKIVVTLKEAAEILNVSKPTVLRHIKRGRIRAIYDYLPGRYFIEMESLRAFANSRYIELPYKGEEK